MEQINYESLLILTILAFMTPILSSSFKRITIPIVVIEITLGIIIGKSGFNLIHDDIVITFLSSFGLAYLMFLSGLEIDFNMLRKKNGNSKLNFKNPLLLSTIMFLISLIVSFLFASYLLNAGYLSDRYFATLILVASAPGIVIPVLSQAKVINTAYGQTLLIFSIIAEFVTLILLTVVISIQTQGFGIQNFLFILVFVAFFAIYFIIKNILNKVAYLNPILYTQHVRVRAAFALILILGTLSEQVGVEIILGSFLAGVIFSLITDKTKEELKSNLEAIGYGFLIPIFFIMVGVNLDLKLVFTSASILQIIPIILLIVLLSKLLPSLILSFFYGVKRSISAGFLLASQLSLMIVGAQLAYNANIIDESMYSAFILVTVLSSLLFPPLFIKLYGKNTSGNEEATKIMGRIQMKEFIITNPDFINKQLSDVCFPDGCRVFLIVRKEREIIPSGKTRLRENDHVIVVGFKDELHNLENTLDTENTEE